MHIHESEPSDDLSSAATAVRHEVSANHGRSAAGAAPLVEAELHAPLHEFCKYSLLLQGLDCTCHLRLTLRACRPMTHLQELAPILTYPVALSLPDLHMHTLCNCVARPPLRVTLGQHTCDTTPLAQCASSGNGMHTVSPVQGALTTIGRGLHSCTQLQLTATP